MLWAVAREIWGEINVEVAAPPSSWNWAWW